MHDITQADQAADAAPVRAALALAGGNAEDPRVRAALAGIMGLVRATADPPDFDAARTLRPDLPKRPVNDAPVGLIIETRRHRNLPFVVRQVTSFCDIPVQVMHGPGNAHFVNERLADLIAEGRVVPTALGGNRLNGRAFNGLLLDRAFWDTMIGRGKILMFQTDSMLCRKSKYQLADFLEFDFIGSRLPTGRAKGCGLIYNSMNGGLSVRDWNRSTAALERFPPDKWPSGEDAFFSFFVEADGGRVGAGADCDRFCGQRWFKRGCFGLHKPRFHDPRLFTSILRYEPNAWRLVGPVERRLARG